jgi:hypothetical protein
MVKAFDYKVLHFNAGDSNIRNIVNLLFPSR